MSQKQIVVGPKLLIVVLNRGTNEGKNSKYSKSPKSWSSHNSNHYSNYERSPSKYDHTVEFDENLVLTNGNEYDLRAVCNHSRHSADGGHYTADVKQLSTNIWHHCNDSSIVKTHQRYSKRSTFYNCDDAMMMIFSKK